MLQKTFQTCTVSTVGVGRVVKNIKRLDGLIISYTDAGAAGLFISAVVTGPTQSATVACNMYEAVASILAEKSAVLVHERAFTSLSRANDLISSRRQAFSSLGVDPDTPYSVIQGHPPWGEGVSGSLFHAVPSSLAGTETISIDARPVGRRWSTSVADYLVLQLSGNKVQSPLLQIQADKLFDVAADLVAGHGFSFSDVARTWFYIRDIVEHYRTFNTVRDQKYTSFGLMPKPPTPLRLPASTGIGGSPINGAALAADILAIRFANGDAVWRLSNPGQEEAFNYGASFSRATLIREQNADLIQVSGTASIGEDGKTLYAGDGASQIACTLDKLEALLETASARLDHVATANIFVKDPALLETFQQIAKERGLSDFPGVPIIADVCRDDLLFEIDAEVVVPKGEAL